MQDLKSMNPNLTTVKYTANPWEGYETSEEDIKRVIELIKEKYENYSEIKFYKAIPNRNKYIIEKMPLSV